MNPLVYIKFYIIASILSIPFMVNSQVYNIYFCGNTEESKIDSISILNIPENVREYADRRFRNDTVDLSGLYLTDFPDLSNLVNFNEIKVLDLSNNNISLKLSNTFICLPPNIEVLNLSHNRLSQQFVYSKELSSLKIIDLSYNYLSSAYIIMDCNDSDFSLKHLNLSHNKLGQIMFPPYCGIEYLDISFNYCFSNKVQFHPENFGKINHKGIENESNLIYHNEIYPNTYKDCFHKLLKDSGYIMNRIK